MRKPNRITMTTYILLAQELKDTILDKDVGSILRILEKKYEYNVRLVLPKDSVSMEYAKEKGIPVEFIPLIFRSNKRIVILLRTFFAVIHLIKNAKRIDILNLYHPTYYSWILGGIYKLINPKGVLYLKMDSSLRIPEKLLLFVLNVLSFFDVITIETEVSLKKAKDVCRKEYLKHPRLKYTSSKLHFVPNGVFREELHKKRIPKVLTVLHGGRIGAPPKNSQLVIETVCDILSQYPNIPLKLLLVGRIMNDNLRRTIAQCSKTHPHSVIYLGHIKRKKMNEVYKKSSILIMPSIWESFGLMTIEAGANSLILVLSDIPVFREITRNGKLGYLCPKDDKTCYQDKLLRIIQNKKESQKMSTLLRKLVEKRYTWENISSRVYRLLSKTQGVDP